MSDSLSYILAAALAHLLDNNEGVVVELKNAMKNDLPNVNKVIVYKEEKTIKIMEADDDAPDGEMAIIHEGKLN